MKLSKSSAHAALALAFLANRTEDGPTQARQVAEHLNIPVDSALKILQALARGQLIQSQLGRAGGYRLHHRPENVSLLEIVEVMDGPIAAQVPLTHAEDAGASIDLLEAACRQAATSLRSELSRYTVADLARQSDATIAARN